MIRKSQQTGWERAGWVWVLAAWCAAVCGGCAGSAGVTGSANLQRFESKRVCMGVQTRVILYAVSRDAADEAANAAYKEIGRVEEIMSDYRPASELSRVNARAGEGAENPHAERGGTRVSPALFEILRTSLTLARATDGAFDPTVGPVVAQWREARRTGVLAPEDVRAAAVALVGWRKVELDEAARTVRLSKAGMRLDLGGIAKGYAAQRAVEVLKSRGVERCLVAMSGDIVVGEAPPGREGWEIEVQGGHIGHAASEVGSPRLLLKNAAVSTSGDTEQFIEIEGRRYSHIVDARTGLGTAGGLSVTVLADRGEIADALGTAVCVMGAQKGETLLRSWDGVAAILEARRGDALPETQRTVIDPSGRLRWVEMSGR